MTNTTTVQVITDPPGSSIVARKPIKLAVFDTVGRVIAPDEIALIDWGDGEGTIDPDELTHTYEGPLERVQVRVFLRS